MGGRHGGATLVGIGAVGYGAQDVDSRSKQRHGLPAVAHNKLEQTAWTQQLHLHIDITASWCFMTGRFTEVGSDQRLARELKRAIAMGKGMKQCVGICLELLQLSACAQAQMHAACMHTCTDQWTVPSHNGRLTNMGPYAP